MTNLPQPYRVGFLLIPGFALMSYASAIEPLRAANLLSGNELFSWTHFSVDGAPVVASSGAAIPCDERLATTPQLDLILVCAGGNPSAFNDRNVFAWLRRADAMGIAIGGVSGGPYILARAGLMKDRHMTVHWEHAAALSEEFPELMLSRALYIVDRNRLTCAGGVAPLDMMHALIAERHGANFATRVSDWFLHTDIRPAGGPQRASMTERYGIHRPELIAALEFMEHNLGRPHSRASVAARIGLSTRQLDRLFADQLGTSFATHYRTIRLDRARDLIRQTALSITEIALACGFSNPGHFSRCYRERFGMTPRTER
jgi:transcriptional regulator GlxA family with amidase domain